MKLIEFIMGLFKSFMRFIRRRSNNDEAQPLLATAPGTPLPGKSTGKLKSLRNPDNKISYTQHVGGIDNLLKSLREIPGAERLSFALDHKDTIENAQQLTHVLMEFRGNPEQCALLAKGHIQRIQKPHELAAVLTFLKKEDYQAIVDNAPANEIVKRDSLPGFLEAIKDPNERMCLAIAYLNRDQIPNEKYLEVICKTLPAEHQARFRELWQALPQTSAYNPKTFDNGREQSHQQPTPPASSTPTSIPSIRRLGSGQG